jgi:hypothetical protein
MGRLIDAWGAGLQSVHRKRNDVRLSSRHPDLASDHANACVSRKTTQNCFIDVSLLASITPCLTGKSSC